MYKSTGVGSTVQTAEIDADAITGAQIADDAVGSEHIEALDAGITISGGAFIVGREAVVAAGSNQGDGTAITCSHPLVTVTGADATKGVTLVAVSGLTVGQNIKILNFAASALEVYPASGDAIYPAADNAGISVAAYGMLELFVYDGTGWAGNEGVVKA